MARMSGFKSKFPIFSSQAILDLSFRTSVSSFINWVRWHQLNLPPPGAVGRILSEVLCKPQGFIFVDLVPTDLKEPRVNEGNVGLLLSDKLYPDSQGP